MQHVYAPPQIRKGPLFSTIIPFGASKYALETRYWVGSDAQWSRGNQSAPKVFRGECEILIF